MSRKRGSKRDSALQSGSLGIGCVARGKGKNPRAVSKGTLRASRWARVLAGPLRHLLGTAVAQRCDADLLDTRALTRGRPLETSPFSASRASVSRMARREAVIFPWGGTRRRALTRSRVSMSAFPSPRRLSRNRLLSRRRCNVLLVTPPFCQETFHR